jgi:hypothetical protein
MREELGKHNGQRLRFHAVVDRFGSKKGFKGWPEKTLLLANIALVETGEVVTDHLWFTVRKTLDKLGLEPGSVVRFDARVTIYRKGYEKDQLDYKLSRPTNFSVGEVNPKIVQEAAQLSIF